MENLVLTALVQFLIVGGDDDGGAAGGQFLEEVQNQSAAPVVQVAGGFIGQQQSRMVGGRPGDGHPLLFPQRQRRHRALLFAGQVELFQQLAHPLADKAAGAMVHLQGHCHIMLHAQLRQQSKILIGHTDLAADLLHGGAVDAGQVPAEEHYQAAAWGFPPTEQFKQSAFAGPAGAGDKDNLAGSRTKRNIAKGSHVRGIDLAEPDAFHRKSGGPLAAGHFVIDGP